ncbi:MAG: hypothetical protein AAFR46_18400 [Pseudomonadota bacterium]
MQLHPLPRPKPRTLRGGAARPTRAARPVQAVAAALGLALLGSAAGAEEATVCNTRDQVTVYFKSVQAGYLQRADAITPDEYALWGRHLDRFAEAVRRNDLQGACVALRSAARALDLDILRVAASAAGG